MSNRKHLLASLVATIFAAPIAGLAQTAPAPAAPPPSDHTFTANVALASQYIFRGLTQTNEKPAIQGGFDYSHSSGVYVGTWLSNISWFTDTNVGSLAAPATLGGLPRGVSASLEWDIYGGYKGTFATDWAYDVGFLHYEYPGKYDGLTRATPVKPNTDEVYGLIGWKWATLKYSYSIGDTFGLNDSSGSFYVDASINYPIPDTPVTVIAHVGKQKFKGRSDFLKNLNGTPAVSFDNDAFTYTDWKLGAALDLSGVAPQLKGATLTAYFTGTDADDSTVDAFTGTAIPIWQNAFGKNVGKGQFTVMFGKTF